MDSRIRRWVVGVFFLALMSAAVVYFASTRGGADGPLQASGTVEAQEILVAFQLGGQVSEVHVQEGEYVRKGDLLLRFEDQALQAQLEGAESALVQAQANLEFVQASPLAEERRLAIASARLELLDAEQALADLWEMAGVARAQAELDLAEARQALDDAQYQWDLNQPGNRARDYTLKAARATVKITEKRLDRAQKAFDMTHGKIAKAKAQVALSEAHRAYDRAVWMLDWLESGADEFEQAILDAVLSLSEENVAFAQAELEKLEDGPDPDALSAAQARLERAEAQLAMAEADTTEERLAQARAQVTAAEANLKVIQAQIDKLSLTAPSDGVVLFRAVDPGEVVTPGAPALTLGRLEDLTITVFIPEDQYGAIELGQSALVSVDSFPGSRFSATVVRVADQAEFTPRNVQTPEGRRTTVFAVELSVQDDSSRLKPGMPADVVFQG